MAKKKNSPRRRGSSAALVKAKSALARARSVARHKSGHGMGTVAKVAIGAAGFAALDEKVDLPGLDSVPNALLYGAAAALVVPMFVKGKLGGAIATGGLGPLAEGIGTIVREQMSKPDVSGNPYDVSGNPYDAE